MVIFFQYLKNNIDEVYFLDSDKDKSFRQVDTNILGVFGQTKFKKKIVSQLLLCSVVMQKIHIFYGDLVMFVSFNSFSTKVCLRFQHGCVFLLKRLFSI